jgi:translation initiation factor 4E
MNRIMLIGRHFKVNVLGFGLNDSITNEGQLGSLNSEVNFESHKDSEVKGNKKKIVL